MKLLNAALTFLLELLLLGCIFVMSLHLFKPLIWAIVIAIATAVTVGTVWGLLLAPRAKNRLKPKIGLLLATILLSFGPITIMVFDQNWLSFLILTLYGINRILAVNWKQW